MDRRGAHLSDFSLFYANGQQSSGNRDGLLTEFEAVQNGIVTNARCLTEGINVPAVDVVTFMAPKKSRIDIAQAAGRAMRKDRERPEEDTGYILVPIFLEKTSAEKGWRKPSCAPDFPGLEMSSTRCRSRTKISSPSSPR